MRIKIGKYDINRNEYTATHQGIDIKFDPFVSGILNGEDHDRVIIDELEGEEVDLDLFQTTSGAWILTSNGEQQFKDLIDKI